MKLVDIKDINLEEFIREHKPISNTDLSKLTNKAKKSLLVKSCVIGDYPLAKKLILEEGSEYHKKNYFFRKFILLWFL